jgi:TRAP-type uncharacterized transport system substrate-binding protein
MNVSLSRLLLVAAALIALMTISAAGYLMWSRPLHLRVAAGPQGSVDAKLMTAFNRMLDLTHAGVRLDVVPTAGVHDNNLLVEKGDVDMAVVRLDDPLPMKRVWSSCFAPTSSSPSRPHALTSTAFLT